MNLSVRDRKDDRTGTGLTSTIINLIFIFKYSLLFSKYATYYTKIKYNVDKLNNAKRKYFFLHKPSRPALVHDILFFNL